MAKDRDPHFEEFIQECRAAGDYQETCWACGTPWEGTKYNHGTTNYECIGGYVYQAGGHYNDPDVCPGAFRLRAVERPPLVVTGLILGVRADMPNVSSSPIGPQMKVRWIVARTLGSRASIG